MEQCALASTILSIFFTQALKPYAQDHVDRDIPDAAGRLARPRVYEFKVFDLELVGRAQV